MKVVILAGGTGTRISEETHLRPKPMIEVGGKPVLWHIMKTYSAYGLHDFIICCGYRGYMIKEYFANYALHMSDVTFDMRQNSMRVHENSAEPWSVTLVDTGEQTATGGRLKRVRQYLGGEAFCFTYGDGLSNIDIRALIQHHADHKLPATVTVTRPPGRFGVLMMNRDKVTRFEEKPPGDGGGMNGGFFVGSPAVGCRTAWVPSAFPWGRSGARCRFSTPFAGRPRCSACRSYSSRVCCSPCRTPTAWRTTSPNSARKARSWLTARASAG